MRYSALFVNNKTKKIWTKSFRSKSSLTKAVMGITKKTNNRVKTKNGWTKKPTSMKSFLIEKSKGFRYSRDIKNCNKSKNCF
jgi:hypothetical protein